MRQFTAVFLSLGLLLSAAVARAQTPTVTPTPQPVATLALEFSAQPALEGGPAVIGTVRASQTPTRDVTVILTAADRSFYPYRTSAFELQMPSAVVLRVGRREAAFRIEVLEDQIVNVPRTVDISAVASGYCTAFTQFVARDNDRPILFLNLDVTSIREDETARAMGTLTSNDSRSGEQRVALSSSDPTRVQVPASIGYYTFASARFSIVVRDDNLNIGPQPVRITASLPGFQSATVTLLVIDKSAPRLSLRIAPNVIEEAQGDGAATGTISRQGDLSQELIIGLRSIDTDEVQVQPSLVLPPRVASATFSIDAVDDRLLDSTQTVTIAANPVGAGSRIYASARATVSVRNSNPDVTAYLTRTAFSEDAGPRASLLVLKLTRAYPDDLTIGLGVGNQRLIVPRSVVIPAGKTLISVPVGVRNDNRTDSGGNEYVSVGRPFPVESPPSSGGIPSIILFVTVFEDDGPISLTLSRNEFNEGAGIGVALGTVSRRIANGEPLTVTLKAERTSGGSAAVLVRVPRQIVIAAGARSATFAVDILNDNQFGGSIPQINLITAKAVINGQPVQAVQAQAGVFIHDDELNQILLRFDSEIIGENGLRRAIATLYLEGPAPAAYTFSLISSNPSRVRVPSSVVLPAGSTSVSFPVDAIDNLADDGNAVITIQARKTGFRSGSGTITVIDDDGAA